MRHQLFAKWVVGAVAALSFGCVACGDDDQAAADASASVDSAAVDSGDVADAIAADADQPDARCGADLHVTGDYTQLDSDDINFLGIPDSTWVEVGNAGNTHTTPPNGRVAMCLATGPATKLLRATHASYLPLTFTMSMAAAQMNASFGARGLTGARLDQLFTALSLGTPDSGRAQVMVEVRRHPSGAPLIGATVAIGNANDGAFTQNSSGDYTAGATLTDGKYVFFADVDLGGGNTTVTVTPPTGSTCTGLTAAQPLALTAGEISFTSFACD